MRGVQGGLTQGPRVCKVQRALAVYGHTAGALHTSNKYTQTAHQCTRQHAHKPHVNCTPCTRQTSHTNRTANTCKRRHPHTPHTITHTRRAHKPHTNTHARHTHNHAHTRPSSPTHSLVPTHTITHMHPHPHTHPYTQSYNDATACTSANPATERGCGMRTNEKGPRQHALGTHTGQLTHMDRVGCMRGGP